MRRTCLRRLCDMVAECSDDIRLTVTPSPKKQHLNSLRALCSDSSSHLFLVHDVLTLPLLPSRCGEEMVAIRQMIEKMQSTYVKALKGFLIDYEEMKLASPWGSIKGDLPYIFWDVEADFFVFRPTVGTMLEGMINKFEEANSNTICYVHDSFPASVQLPHPIPPALTKCFELCRKIKFQVTEVDFNKCLLVGVVDEDCIAAISADALVKRAH